MDNEKQIKDLVTRSKNVFLRDAIPELSEKRQYILEDEFAKTKKNKSILIWSSLLVLVLIFAVTTILLTRSIQKSTEDVQVQVADFEDVNLQDVLDRAKRLEASINTIQLQIGRLREERQLAINEIIQDLTRNRELINNQRISDEEKQRRIRDANAESTAREKRVTAEYDAKIAELEVELKSLQSEMEQYDARRVAQAREQEEILNNQKRVFDLEMSRVVEEYENRIEQLQNSYEGELRKAREYQESLQKIIQERHGEEVQDVIFLYNPVMTGEAINTILNEPIEISETPQIMVPTPPEQLGKENILTEDEYNKVLAQIERLSVILSELYAIPYENSVAPALRYMEKSVTDLLTGFNSILIKASETLVRKNDNATQLNRNINSLQSNIDQYRYALEALVRQNRETGYIIDARNTRDIAYFLHDLYQVKDGDFGLVFREDTEYIGKIRFIREGSRIRATLLELGDEQKQMQPFDKILLEVTQETE